MTTLLANLPRYYNSACDLVWHALRLLCLTHKGEGLPTNRHVITGLMIVNMLLSYGMFLALDKPPHFLMLLGVIFVIYAWWFHSGKLITLSYTMLIDIPIAIVVLFAASAGVPTPYANMIDTWSAIAWVRALLVIGFK